MGRSVLANQKKIYIHQLCTEIGCHLEHLLTEQLNAGYPLYFYKSQQVYDYYFAFQDYPTSQHLFIYKDTNIAVIL